jgi:hypothetical protein
MGGLETDYLVVGAGLAGLAFADALVAHSDADVVLVDRRDRPGGHWLDAYPFVRLHLPSAFYGVASLPLGGRGRDADGFAERATGSEVLAHLQSALDDVLLPTGRVRFRAEHEYGEGPDGPLLVDRRTGDTVPVTVRRAVVDATWLAGEVPATHRPSFTVDPGARCVPVGELDRLGADGERYSVLGSGKTAMDAVVRLLEQGVEPDRVRWVRPRDPWLLDRRSLQPHEDVPSVMEGLSLDVEAVARSATPDELFARLEETGRLVRLDRATEPTMYRCAIVSPAELELLRSVGDVVRAGRVRHVGVDRLLLDGGEVTAGAADVAVDCTARGIGARGTAPAFAPGRITLQQVRACQPSFNAALLGYVAATRDDVAEQNRLCPPHPYPTAPADWGRGLAATLATMDAWRRVPDVQAWVDGCRLNVGFGLDQHLDDPRAQAGLRRFLENVGPAAARLRTAGLPGQRPAQRAPDDESVAAAG